MCRAVAKPPENRQGGDHEELVTVCMVSMAQTGRVVFGVRSGGQEEAVAARTEGWGAGGLRGKGTGVAGDLWRRRGCSRSCPKPDVCVRAVATLGLF